VPEPVAQLRVVGGSDVMTLSQGVPQGVPVVEEEVAVEELPAEIPAIVSLQTLEIALKMRKYSRLAAEVYQYVRMGRIEEGRMEIAYDQQLTPTMLSDLSKALKDITGQVWLVTESRQATVPTLAEQQRIADEALLVEAQNHPLVSNILQMFPGSTVKVKSIQ
jgi:DNA polymerase-3 subunit gamma/tau